MMWMIEHSVCVIRFRGQKDGIFLQEIYSGGKKNRETTFRDEPKWICEKTEVTEKFWIVLKSSVICACQLNAWVTCEVSLPYMLWETLNPHNFLHLFLSDMLQLNWSSYKWWLVKVLTDTVVKWGVPNFWLKAHRSLFSILISPRVLKCVIHLTSIRNNS